MSPTKAPAPATKPVAKKKISSGVALAIVVGAVVGIAVVVALIAGLASNGTTTAKGVKQTQPVEFTGTALSPFDSAATPDPGVGTAAPTLTGSSFDGSSVVIKPADGKPKLLAFVAHWCPHCRAEVPRIVEWNASGQKPANLELFAISTAVDERAPNYPPSSWFEKEKWPAPVMADDGQGDAAKMYGLPSYPYIVLVGGDGKVLARHSGEFGDVASLDAWVKAAVPAT